MQGKEISIAGREVGERHRPFLVAEMSGNHNQSLERAIQIVEAAAYAGVDALKLQTYTADSMTLNTNRDGFLIEDSQSLWEGKILYDLYREASTPWEWHQPIFDLCRELGIVGFSSPCDVSAVDFLESLDVTCYKIGSFENTDLPLIRKVAATGKPTIISTGMATLEELNETVKAVREAGCQDLILLKCNSVYPAHPSEANLRTISDMRKRFQCLVGISDHSLGIGVAVASVAFGACMIEKHFTVSRASAGVDAAFSLEPEEMKLLVSESRRAWEAIGNVHFGPTEREKKSLQFRRSIYIAEDMKAGEKFTSENLRIIRPGYGLPPKYYDPILGKIITADAKLGTPLTWDLVGVKEEEKGLKRAEKV